MLLYNSYVIVDQLTVYQTNLARVSFIYKKKIQTTYLVHRYSPRWIWYVLLRIVMRRIAIEWIDSVCKYYIWRRPTGLVASNPYINAMSEYVFSRSSYLCLWISRWGEWNDASRIASDCFHRVPYPHNEQLLIFGAHKPTSVVEMEIIFRV